MKVIVKPDTDQISSRASIRSYFASTISSEEEIIIDLTDVKFISRSALQELTLIMQELNTKKFRVKLKINSKEISKMYHKVILNKKSIINIHKLSLHKSSSDEDLYKYLETVS